MRRGNNFVVLVLRAVEASLIFVPFEQNAHIRTYYNSTQTVFQKLLKVRRRTVVILLWRRRKTIKQEIHRVFAGVFRNDLKAEAVVKQIFF